MIQWSQLYQKIIKSRVPTFKSKNFERTDLKEIDIRKRLIDFQERDF